MRKVILFISVVVISAISLGAVYKWVDDEGRVHYSDEPTDRHKTKEVEIEPGPSPEEIEKAQEQAEKLRQREAEFIKRQQALEHEKSIEPKDAADDWNPKCFTNSVELLGEGKVDPFEEVQPIAVTRQELNTLQSMLQKLEGGWHGKNEEVRCLGTKEAPRMTTRHYDIQTKIYWGEGLLEIKSDMVRRDDMERRENLLLWPLFKEGQDFRGTRHPDTPIWAVEVVSIEPSSLIFVRKYRVRGAHGTSVHRIELILIKSTRNTLTIRELFYSQDILDYMRTWVLKR